MTTKQRVKIVMIETYKALRLRGLQEVILEAENGKGPPSVITHRFFRLKNSNPKIFFTFSKKHFVGIPLQ